MSTENSLSNNEKVVRWFTVAALVYALLIAVSMIGSGFKAAAGDSAKTIFEFAENPFLGLLVGILCTSLIQSSSTVTSIIVGLVAGGMPVEVAIPMVMGANIGTTITNTLVSMGHIRDKDEFKAAFSAATVHDFFNWLAVLIFLPLEIMFGFLAKLSGYISSYLVGSDSMSMSSFNFIKPITKPVVKAIAGLFDFLPGVFPGVAVAILGVIIILASITLLGKCLKQLLVGGVKQGLHKMIGRGPVAGITSGTVVTVLVQSSSTTTSLMVPLVGSGVFSLRQVYPFTLGSNIGTTITALLAATAVSSNAGLALQIAVVHLMFNVLAVLIIYGIPPLRNIPLWAAEKLCVIAAENKSIAFGYVLSLFFLLPALMVFVFK